MRPRVPSTNGSRAERGLDSQPKRGEIRALAGQCRRNVNGRPEGRRDQVGGDERGGPRHHRQVRVVVAIRLRRAELVGRRRLSRNEIENRIAIGGALGRAPLTSGISLIKWLLHLRGTARAALRADRHRRARENKLRMTDRRKCEQQCCDARPFRREPTHENYATKRLAAEPPLVSAQHQTALPPRLRNRNLRASLQSRQAEPRIPLFAIGALAEQFRAKPTQKVRSLAFWTYECGRFGSEPICHIGVQIR